MDDMKAEILNRLQAVYNALDKTTVSGRQNLNNVSASMGILEDVIARIRRCEIAEIVEHKAKDTEDKAE